jgi:hypothetical protein
VEEHTFSYYTKKISLSSFQEREKGNRKEFENDI